MSALDPHFVGLDIETDTSTGGLDPRESRIISWSIASESGVAFYSSSDEEALIAALVQTMQGQTEHASPFRPIIFCTWNGSGFDFPFLDTRLSILTGQAKDALLPFWPWRLHLADDRAPKYEPIGGHPGGYRVDFPTLQNVFHMDVAYGMKAWCDATGTRWALKPTMQALDLELVGEFGSKTATLSRSTLAAYNVCDAEGTRRLALDVYEDDGLIHVDPKQP